MQAVVLIGIIIGITSVEAFGNNQTTPKISPAEMRVMGLPCARIGIFNVRIDEKGSNGAIGRKVTLLLRQGLFQDVKFASYSSGRNNDTNARSCIKYIGRVGGKFSEPMCRRFCQGHFGWSSPTIVENYSSGWNLAHLKSIKDRKSTRLNSSHVKISYA